MRGVPWPHAAGTMAAPAPAGGAKRRRGGAPSGPGQQPRKASRGTGPLQAAAATCVLVAAVTVASLSDEVASPPMSPTAGDGSGHGQFESSAAGPGTASGATTAPVGVAPVGVAHAPFVGELVSTSSLAAAATGVLLANISPRQMGIGGPVPNGPPFEQPPSSQQQQTPPPEAAQVQPHRSTLADISSSPSQPQALPRKLKPSKAPPPPRRSRRAAPLSAEQQQEKELQLWMH